MRDCDHELDLLTRSCPGGIVIITGLVVIGLSILVVVVMVASLFVQSMRE